MQKPTLLQQTDAIPAQTTRLFYLDWLRVIATLGVFLFHVSDVFNTAAFEIKNAEQSDLITMIQGAFYPWGMPLFFFVAGAGSWFALRRRSASQFRRERTLRLLVPFLTGTLLLGPLQLYLSWRHRVETGMIDWTFGAFVAERFARIGPKLFGAIGYHMWFLGYLFAFSLLALPLLVWLKEPAGQRWVERLVRLCAPRGGILLFILPLVVVRLLLQPFFPVSHDWADFFSFGLFFVLGYLIFADPRFTQLIRRDWWILLAVGLVGLYAFGVVVTSIDGFDIEKAPTTLLEFLVWVLVAVCGWCGTALMVFVGMRSLDHDSNVLRYGQETLLPFFVIHQPVVLVIAYFVVQWQANLWIKFLIVTLASFVISIGISEWLFKRIAFLRLLFGMKDGQPKQTGLLPKEIF